MCLGGLMEKYDLAPADKYLVYSKGIINEDKQKVLGYIYKERKTTK